MPNGLTDEQETALLGNARGGDSVPPIDWPGETPWEDIARAFQAQCPDGFEMQLVGKDAEIATAAINQGIDSRLEAVTFHEKPGWKNTHKLGFPKLHLNFTVKGLLVFLRRLYEYGQGDTGVDTETQELGDAACDLRGAILQCLDIEEC